MKNIVAAPNTLFCFGLGYTARILSEALLKDNWIIAGTSRNQKKIKLLRSSGFHMNSFDSNNVRTASTTKLSTATHILISIPPDDRGDVIIKFYEHSLRKLKNIRWIGYLSTTGVYGNTDGAVVNETSPLSPTSNRSRRRLAAEYGWNRLYQKYGLPVHIFRLPGIYGPGRSVFDKIRAGKQKRIRKPGHYFSRIHVDDIVSALVTSIGSPTPGATYNVCDDEAAAPEDVATFAYKLLGLHPPPIQNWGDVKNNMTEMALSFWQDSRIIDNSFIKSELGWQPKYPSFRDGLSAILKDEN